MFYVLMYALLAFGSFTILIKDSVLSGDILVLLLTSVIFFIMYKKYISDLGGKDKAKIYHNQLLNIEDVSQIDDKHEVLVNLNPQLEYEQARVQLMEIAHRSNRYKDVSNDGSEVVINDERFHVGKKRWAFLLFVFLIADIFTPYLSNWAFYIFSILNFIMIFVAMAPFVIESYHGFKKTGLKKTLQWITFGVAAIFVLNIANEYLFDYFNFSPDSSNQAIIEMMLKENFFRVAFEVTFTAAIFEELVFRGIFFRNLYTKNKLLAYLITFLAFGMPHLLVGFIEGAGIAEFMFLPIYGGMGVLFAYIYSKTNSVFTAIGAHFVNNLISVVILFFI